MRDHYWTGFRPHWIDHQATIYICCCGHEEGSLASLDKHIEDNK